jgi:hypothetical protein
MPASLLKSLLVPVSAHEHDTELLAGSSDVLVQLNELRREGATRRAPMCADINADHVHPSQVFERVRSAASMRGLRSSVKCAQAAGIQGGECCKSAQLLRRQGKQGRAEAASPGTPDVFSFHQRSLRMTFFFLYDLMVVRERQIEL